MEAKKVVSNIIKSFANLSKSENLIYLRYVIAVIIVLSTFPISAGLTKHLQSRNYDNEYVNDFFSKGVSILLVRFVTLIILLLIALNVAKVNKLFIATYAGFFFLALPAAMATQISNYVSGLLLIAFNRIQLNDYVIIGDFEGRIRKLNLLSIEVQDQFTKKTRYVPNNKFWSDSFVNVSKSSTVVVKVAMTVASDNDFERIENKILSVIDEKFEGIDVSTVKIKYEHSTWGVKIVIGCEVQSNEYFEYKMLLLKTLRKELDKDEEIEYVK